MKCYMFRFGIENNDKKLGYIIGVKYLILEYSE